MARTSLIAGFWSYAHLDDQHEGGRISRLRERLETSIQFYSGVRAFKIFQDRKDIGWGESWSQRISTNVEDALILFPIATPSYFSSSACIEEASAFQHRQQSLGRNDLILPIYYVTSDHFEAPTELPPDTSDAEIAKVLNSHQYEDWRTLRETPETDPAYGKAIERLARRAVEALKRGRDVSQNGDAGAKLKSSGPRQSPLQREDGATPAAEATSSPAAHTSSAVERSPGHIITLTVNPMPGRAQFTTISEAVARAPGGARILIAAGHYRESVTIDKPLELIGEGPIEDIIIETETTDTLIFDTNIGVVRGLTLRQRQKDPQDFCVWVKQGRLELEDCDLSSTGLNCLAVMSNADPRVRRNVIHGAPTGGILICDQGRGTYEDNEIFDNGFAGIEVYEGGDPVVRRNRIYDGKQSGIFVHDDGRGTYEDNEIFRNKLAGISVTKGSEPIMRRNRIYGCDHNGISIYAGGRGTFEDNDIFANEKIGISVREDSDPVFRRNKIYDSKQSGILVSNNGRGIYEENDIHDNRLAGISVTSGSDPVARRNKIYKGKQGGIFVYDDGRGTFEDNEIFENTLAGIEVKGSQPSVRRNYILGGHSNGIYVHTGGGGIYEGNEISGNARAGIRIVEGAKIVARKNKIFENRQAAIQVGEGGAGDFQDNDLRDNHGGAWAVLPSAEAQVVRARNRT